MATNGGENSVAFSKWREVDINDDDYARGDTDAPVDNKTQSEDSDDEDPASFFRMFGEEDEEDVYEDVRYDYQTPSSSLSSSPSSASTTTTTVVIRHHGAYPNSTGLAVWRGSEILARFLCDQQQLCDNKNSNNSNDQDGETETTTGVVEVRQKKVLEVGAGAGLPGIVAHRVLGAKNVLVTDGDYDALNNLRHNVDANKLPCGKDNDAGDDDAVAAAATNTTISCQQLIWGRAVGAFLETHGKQDVVLAADCVYMVPSLQPLWKTIDALLKDDGLFVYAQTAASTVPWKDFSEMVELHGFESFFQVVGKNLDRYDVDNDEDDSDNANGNRREDEEYELGIYVFRRRR